MAILTARPLMGKSKGKLNHLIEDSENMQVHMSIENPISSPHAGERNVTYV